MSLTENTFIVPFSLTGISNFNGSVNGGGVVSNITILGQTQYLTSSLVDGNGNIDLDLHIPTATGSTTGLLSSTDWNTFNNKQATITATSPINFSSNIVSIPQANATTNGYLSSTDWNTFNAGSVDILPLNNTFTGKNTFNNDVTINCNGTGLTGSPKLLLSLPDFRTEVNDIDNLYRIVQTGANKSFYLSRFMNQKYSHYPLNLNDNPYTFTLSTTEYLDGCYIYSGVYLTADRTIFLPINTQFSTVYGTNYACSFTILTATSVLNNFKWKIDKTGASVNTTMYVNQVLQTSYPFFLSLNTPYICEVETFLAGSTQILIYNFRSLEKAQTIPNLQQVLTSGNTATSTNLDLTNGALLASLIETDILISNTGTFIDVISDLFINSTIAVDFEGDILIERNGVGFIDTTDATYLNIKKKLRLYDVSSSTTTNQLYYNTTTKIVSYGPVPTPISDATFTNMLTMRSTTGNTITYNATVAGINIIQRILTVAVTHTQGALCGTNLDTANYRFDVTTAGRYKIEVNLNVRTSSAAYDVNTLLRLNGSTTSGGFTISQAGMTAGLGWYASARLMTQLILSVGDQIDFISQGIGATFNASLLNGSSICITRIE